MTDIIYSEGHVFSGPNGQGYRLTRDVRRGEVIKASDFEPIGRAPEPKAGARIPDWLAAQVRVSHD